MIKLEVYQQSFFYLSFFFYFLTNKNNPCLNKNICAKNSSEVDVPLTYADYYYVEALIRRRALLIER
jgi:hypothetical protein